MARIQPAKPAIQLAGQPSKGFFKSPMTVTGGSIDNSDTSEKKASGSDSSDSTDSSEACKKVRATATATQM